MPFQAQARCNSLKLTVVSLTIILANCVDLVTTYLASPDLANEWNILQREFGLGWTGLILAKVVGSLLAIAGYAYYLAYRDACYPAPGLPFVPFCRHFSFGRQADWLDMQRGIPLGVHLGVNLGYFWAGMQALVFWVALDNLMLHAGYVFGPRQYSEMGYHLFQSVVVSAFVLARFYRANYRRYAGAPSVAVAAPAPAVPSTAAAPVEA